MKKLYSYVLRYDDGAAPNPYGGVCTLAICKPIIRRVASIGDWVIGTGSKNSFCNDGKRYDLSSSLVYAMKITDIKTFEEYNHYCIQHLGIKIPGNIDEWPNIVGDCIHHYSQQGAPILRKGVHNEVEAEKDRNVPRVLLSNHFYYFGEKAKLLHSELLELIKRNQGHRTFKDQHTIERFEKWIVLFKENRIYGNPQMMKSTKVRLNNSLKSSSCYSHCGTNI